MMLRDAWNSEHFHTARYEALEERLALSADPLTNLVQQATATTHELASQLPEVKQFGSAFRQAANTGQAWNDVRYVQGNYNLTGAGQTVAVIDSGIAYDHVALGGGYGAGKKVVGGWDFAENDANPYDDAPAGFHGTHVAGIVGAKDATNPGVASGADLVALRVFDDNGNSSFAWVEQSLQWVHLHRNDYANPITTVNLSLGFDWNASTVPEWANLEDEFAQLKSDGIFISVSAGNAFTTYNTTGLSYPAASPYVVPVASVNASGQFSTFSQRNARVLAAPGQGIMSTVPDSLYGADGVKNDWASASGTSMAAPYVAGASALVRQAMQRMGVANINEDTIYSELRSTADIFHDAVTNADYYRVNLRRAIDTVMTSKQAVTTVPAAREDWGTLGFKAVGNQTVSGEKWYSITAANAGLFTVEGVFNGAAGNVDLELYKADGTLVASSRSATNSERVETHVAAGESYSLRVVGTNSNVSLRYTNLVDDSGATVVVHGTNQDDLFNFDASGPSIVIYENGTRYEFSKSQVADFHIFGGSGIDTINVIGSASDETATFSSNSLRMISSAYSITCDGVEAINVNAGSGNDTANFTDTIQNDTYSESAALGQLGGNDYVCNASFFDRYNVNFTQGGKNLAYFNSIASSDTFLAAPNQATFNSANARHTVTGGMDCIYAGASVEVQGTNQDDLFQFDASGASMVVWANSTRYEFSKSQTAEVHLSGGSGIDTIYVTGSASDETATFSSGSLRLSASGYSLACDGVEAINVNAGGGNDTANFTDTAQDDTYNETAARGQLGGSDYVCNASFFAEYNVAFTQGGANLANFNGTDQNDVFTAAPTQATFSNANARHTVTGQMSCVATGGAGNDSATLNGSSGNDTFNGVANSSVLRGTGFYLRADSFEHVAAYGNGGSDTAQLNDTSADEKFTLYGRTRRLEGSDYSLQTDNFGTVRANFSSTGNDTLVIKDLAENDSVTGRQNWLTLSGTDQFVAYGFEQAVAFAKTGQHPRSDVSAVDYLFSKNGF